MGQEGTSAFQSEETMPTKVELENKIMSFGKVGESKQLVLAGE